MNIKTKNTLTKVIRLSFILSITYLLLIFLFTAFALISSPSNFSILNDSNEWLLTFSFNSIQSYTINLSYYIMQKLPPNLINVKIVFITVLIVRNVTTGILYVVSSRVILNIYKEIGKGLETFNHKLVNGTKAIAYMIMIKSLFLDLILNIALIPTSNVFLINLNNIHITGFIYGCIILVIAELFSYGVFLQSEYDTLL